MAYSLIAGVPPAYGLSTAVVGGIVGSLLGSSRHLVTGPTNATSMIFAATLVGYYGGLAPLEAVFLFTLMIGVVKAAFGLFRLGNLVHFLSDSVVIGFLAGVGVLIAGEQIGNFLGVDPGVSRGAHFLERAWASLVAVPVANPWSVALSLAAAAVILACQRIHRLMPGAMLACLVGAGLSWLLDLPSHGVATIGDISAIPHLLPLPAWMPFDAADAPRLVPGAIAVAVIGLMEATAIGRSIAASSGQRLDANREFLGQGAAGIIGAFFHGYASSGSPSRTAVNYLGGARTRMAGVYGGVFVALAMLLFAPVAEAIPIPSLAGMLMVVAFQMIDRRRLGQAWRAGRESATILLVTLAATILLRIDVAIYIGVFTSLAFYIKRSSATEVSALVGGPRGKFREVPLDSVPAEEVRGEPLLVNVVGPLYFGALDEHRREVLRLVDDGACAVVVRMRRVSALDSSAIESLERLHKDLSARHVPLVLCGVDEETMRVFGRTGLLARLGRDRVIPASDTLFDSFLETVRLARRLAGKPEPGPARHDDEPLTWHI